MNANQCGLVICFRRDYTRPVRASDISKRFHAYDSRTFRSYLGSDNMSCIEEMTPVLRPQMQHTCKWFEIRLNTFRDLAQLDEKQLAEVLLC